MFKIQASYKAVQDAMHIFSNQEQNEDDKLCLIKKDLERIVIFPGEYNLRNIKEKLKTIQGNYLQGDFEGATFGGEIVSRRLTEWISNFRQSPHQFLRFCYQNDDDQLCGFSLELLELQFEQDKQQVINPYLISIFNNVTAQPEDRMVTIFANDIFNQVPDEDNQYYFAPPLKQDINSKDLTKQLLESLNSPKIANLILPLFNDNGEINLYKFNALRFRVNIERLDNLLNQFIEMAIDDSLGREELKQKIQEIIKYYNDNDLYTNHEQLEKFYLDEKSDTLPAKMIADLQTYANEMKKFLEENNKLLSPAIKNLICAVICLLLFSAGVLTLTGVLSSKGITLIGSLQITLGIIGTVLSGLLVIAFGYQAFQKNSPQPFDDDWIDLIEKNKNVSSQSK